jgi:hypothetical protein
MASFASVLAALAPCKRWVPDRSRNASSIDSGSTNGVSARIASRTWRPTVTYFCMFGLMMVACGHKRRASNIGIAERTPKVRAM